VFDISPGEGARAEFLPGVISHPEPYGLDITPRSVQHMEVIREVELEVEVPWGKDIESTS
jgi:hypothetical protein